MHAHKLTWLDRIVLVVFNLKTFALIIVLGTVYALLPPSMPSRPMEKFTPHAYDCRGKERCVVFFMSATCSLCSAFMSQYINPIINALWTRGDTGVHVLICCNGGNIGRMQSAVSMVHIPVTENEDNSGNHAATDMLFGSYYDMRRVPSAMLLTSEGKLLKKMDIRYESGRDANVVAQEFIAELITSPR